MPRKQTVRRPASRRPKAHTAKVKAPVAGTLFLSFWNIHLENLPDGNFTRRRIAPEEAARCIKKARQRKELVCLSSEDLLAPYRKRQLDSHKELCRVLNDHFGIPLEVRNFLTRSEGFFFARPLSLARIEANHRLLVVTCMYVMPEHIRSSSALPRFSVDPASVEFHLLESLHPA